MIIEADRDIAKRRPHTGVNVSSGTQPGRLAVHELPILGAADSLRRALRIAPHRLPIPLFPRHPEKCGDVEPDPRLLPRDGNPYRTSVTLPMVRRALRGWLYPYVGSRVKPGDFHPIISRLFTAWMCNPDNSVHLASEPSGEWTTPFYAFGQERILQCLRESGPPAAVVPGGRYLPPVEAPLRRHGRVGLCGPR